MRYLLSLGILGMLATSVLADDSSKDTKLPDELARALKQLTDADSYGFQTSPQGQKQNGVEAKYQKGEPTYFKVDQIEFFKKGDKLIYKQDDKWQRTKTGVESDPLRILVPSAKVRETVLPHEELNGLDKQLDKVRSEPSSGYAAAYAAHLTVDGCKKLLLPADRELARSGRITFQLDKDGNIVEYALAIEIEGKRGNADVKGTVTRTVKLSDIGKTKLDVADAVRKALE